MANTEKVIVNVSPDTFAIDGIEINVKDDSNVDITTAADRFKIVGVGTNDAMAGIYDLTSRAGRALLTRVIALILESEENLVYRIDTPGSSDTDRTLTEITAEPLLRHQYSALLLHDPIYKCYKFTEAERKTTNEIYYRYSIASDAALSTENLSSVSGTPSGSTRASVVSLLEGLGLYASEGKAHGKFRELRSDVALSDMILERYAVEISHNLGDASAVPPILEGFYYKAELLASPLYELPELEMCIPVVPKS